MREDPKQCHYRHLKTTIVFVICGIWLVEKSMVVRGNHVGHKGIGAFVRIVSHVLDFPFSWCQHCFHGLCMEVCHRIELFAGLGCYDMGTSAWITSIMSHKTPHSISHSTPIPLDIPPHGDIRPLGRPQPLNRADKRAHAHVHVILAVEPRHLGRNIARVNGQC